MRWWGSASWRRFVGVALVAAALLVVPLAAQQRSDCVPEEVLLGRFYDVCGSDRQTLTEYNARIAHATAKGGVAAIEEWRLILCDVEREDTAIKTLITDGVAFAASDLPTDENTLITVIESGVLPIARQIELLRTSDRGVLRLARVVADRHAGTESRCWALKLLIDARGNGAALPWVNDTSDPIQSCAAPVAIAELSEVARHEVFTHPEHPLHVELLLNDPVTPQTTGSLCRIASNTSNSPLTRVRAIDRLVARPVSEVADCFASLLQPEEWFVLDGRHSAEIVLGSLLEVDHRRAKLLASSLDTTSIADLDLRQSVDETRFSISSYEFDVPLYEGDPEPDPPER
jgi:hypothetical protein